jgi:restriction endonuclease Mrr
MIEPRMNVRTLPQAGIVSTTKGRNDVLKEVFCKRPIQADNKQKQRIRDKLLDTLLALNVSQFERCIATLLHALEYEDVEIMRRMRPERCSHKGRNHHGGFDICARSSSFSPSLTLVQAKQYARPVARRFVDELRGAMIRQGAQQGLLITTSTFPFNAEASAQENHLLPVVLIDGEHLLDLLFRFSLGVKCRQGKRRLLWRLDCAFFRDLLFII